MTKNNTDLKEKFEEIKLLNKEYRHIIQDIMKDNIRYNNKLCSMYRENTGLLKSRVELSNMILWQNNWLDICITIITFLVIILVIGFMV